MSKFRKLKQIIILIIPFLFLVSFNNIAYKHTHILSNGQALTHAHPLTKDNGSAGTEHKHNKIEFMALSLIYNLSSLLCILFVLLIFLAAIKKKSFVPKAISLKYYHFTNTAHRGPPTDY